MMKKGTIITVSSKCNCSSFALNYASGVMLGVQRYRWVILAPLLVSSCRITIH